MNNSENHRFDHSETTSEGQMSSQNLNSERNQSTQNSDYQQYNRSNQYTSQENNQIAKDEEQDEPINVNVNLSIRFIYKFYWSTCHMVSKTKRF